MSRGLSDVVLPCADRADFAERMRAFYAEVDRAVAAHRPRCQNRGACCRFDSFGHSLYVTTSELAFFVAGNRHRRRPVGSRQTCPYQRDGLCDAREHRPLGCRIFFCDPDAQSWQPDEYESHLRALKQIGADFDQEYRYVEWLSALGDLDAVLGGESSSRGD